MPSVVKSPKTKSTKTINHPTNLCNQGNLWFPLPLLVSPLSPPAARRAAARYATRMPEIPDLEAIRGFLNERIVGVRVTRAEALIPHVVRSGAADFEAALTGNRFGEVLRRGKFLLFGLADSRVMVINAMLAIQGHNVDSRFTNLEREGANDQRRINLPHRLPSRDQDITNGLRSVSRRLAAHSHMRDVFTFRVDNVASVF